MVAILKVTYQFEVRRCILEKQDVSYDDVMDALAKLYPDLGECIPKYLDDEGDACTLCASSFPDFLQLAQLGGGSESKGQKEGRLLLKLQLVDSPSLLPVTRSELRSVMSETAPSLEGAPSASYDALNQSGPSSPRHAEGDWWSNHWGYHPGASYWESSCYPWNAWAHHDLKGKSKGKGKCKGKGKSKGKLFQTECPFRASWHDIFSYACPETENAPAFDETSHKEQTGQEGTQPSLQSILTPEVLAGMVAWKLPELLDMVAGDPEELGHGFAAALAHPPIQGTLQEAMNKRCLCLLPTASPRPRPILSSCWRAQTARGQLPACSCSRWCRV